MDAPIPPALAAAFDGEALDTKLGLSAMLCTVDADGWPHASFLSVGDLLLVAPDEARLVLWPAAATVANLDRSRRGALFAAVEGAVCELRVDVAAIDAADGRGTIVIARIGAMRMHRAPYAEVEGLIDFRLHAPNEVLPRWRAQIELLRSTGGKG